MTVLLLRLAGPMQAWGSSSRFSRRTTEAQPTKSGVIGLLAAAQGLRRSDPLEQLLGLSFGVRLDQPGSLQRDFQTARSLDGNHSFPLSYRYYLADACFVAAVEGEKETLEALDESLRRPTFPLYLGRRSCPPVGPLTLGLREGSLSEVLRAEPWRASSHHRKASSHQVRLDIVIDAPQGEEWSESFQDEPVSFDPRRRLHALRGVVRDQVVISNADGKSAARVDHEPMSALGGA